MAKRKTPLENTSEELIVKNVMEESVENTLWAETENIPEYALSVLKIYPNYPELGICPAGGVYPIDSKLAKNHGAIIYKNPFYNTKN